ncbi:putative aminoacrylate hydrolase RutD [Lachnellula suecica]|uniref:Putative aminoacrylate hydrolase RutD n=1 Tax=Lachnellula suecica TaxID=602035 RepID=A0A8T9CBB3_9HELO|nr:putative aminoacrylate hydrolase RutD [Lachnellula suecica]
MPFTEINQKRLFYTIDEQAEGSSPKTTTLFIHGLGSSSCFYKTIIPSLTPVTRCIALDTPGSGLSSLGTSAQSVSSIAEDAVALLKELKVTEKVVVVGHSMGGIVANHIAATYPELVRGVVLLGPVNPAPALAEVFGKRKEVVKNDGLETLANSVPAATTGSKAGPLQHAFIRSLILGTSPEGYMSLCSVIGEASQPDYGKIKAALLILAGSDDKTAPLSGSDTITKAYGTSEGNKQVEVLAGVGHWHCVEAPEEVGRHMRSFIHRAWVFPTWNHDSSTQKMDL